MPYIYSGQYSGQMKRISTLDLRSAITTSRDRLARLQTTTPLDSWHAHELERDIAIEEAWLAALEDEDRRRHDIA